MAKGLGFIDERGVQVGDPLGGQPQRRAGDRQRGERMAAGGDDRGREAREPDLQLVDRGGVAVAPHCRELVGGYKVPRSVEIRTEPMPISGAGKVLKTVLRAQHRA